ncbi:hypothetical protein GCM10022291_10050 [Postechiella marina]|uniref:Signal transduction histidine kinase internal region domain-containing protein n=1 Tax=Postechiella marina TaxID=943941 RepID=A0ABP8C497_9FLAO
MSVYAQKSKIDSLETLLLTTNKQRDSLRLNVLIELGYAYYLSNPDRGIEVLNEAIKIAKATEDISREAKALQYIGHNYSTKREDSIALQKYDMAIKIYDKIGDRQRKARAIYNKGLIYFNQSDYNRANKNNKEAFLVFKAENDSVLMAKMLNSIGLNYMYQSNYTKSLSKYFEALTIYERLKDTTSIDYASINESIGILYTRLEKFNKAISYHEKAIKIYKTKQYNYGLANSLTNIANAYDYLKEHKKAIDNYNEAFNIMKTLNNKLGMASAKTNIGIAYVSLKNYNKAISYFNQSKPIYQSLNNSNNLAIVHDYIGICYLNSNLKLAQENFKASLRYAKKSHSINLQVNALESLTDVNYKLGNYKNAYKLKEEAVILKDSFYSTEKKEELARLEEQYKFENEKNILENNFERERLIAKEELEHHKHIRNLIVFGGGSFFLLVIGGMFFYRKKRESDFKFKVADTELKALRAQMDPHFLFNSLNSIHSYIIKNDIESATNYLTKFARLIRKTLESSTEKFVPLKDDIEVLKNYLDIEQKRLNNNFTYTINVSNEIDVSSILIPPLILQPFIENSIWHGVALIKNSGEITIEFKKENNMLYCSVDDNGVGRGGTKNITKDNKSIGINLTKNRIDIINEQKKTKGSMTIIDKKQGVKVEVKLPLIFSF